MRAMAAGSFEGGGGATLRRIHEERAQGEWVAKQDMTILGPFGPVNIKTGQPVDDEMQERLDNLCK